MSKHNNKVLSNNMRKGLDKMEYRHNAFQGIRSSTFKLAKESISDKEGIRQSGFRKATSVSDRDKNRLLNSYVKPRVIIKQKTYKPFGKK